MSHNILVYNVSVIFVFETKVTKNGHPNIKISIYSHN